MPKSNEILTTGEVARICKVAPRTVSKWFDSGRLKGYRIPGSKDRRIPRPELLNFMREHGIPFDGLGADKPRALIVGKQSSNKERLEKLLSEGNFETRSADSIFAAGVLAERLKPQVIFWEIQAGSQNGKMIPGNIRAIAQLPDTKVVAMTDTEQTGRDLVGCGFNAFVSEPTDEAKVAELARELADSAR